MVQKIHRYETVKLERCHVVWFVMIKISSIPFTRTFNSSNLLGKELMLRLPMITLFMFSILAFLILEKESASILELAHKSFLLLCLDGYL